MKDNKRASACKMGIIVLTAVIGISIVSCAMLDTLALVSEAMAVQDEGLSEEQRLLVGAWRSDTGHLYTLNEDRTGTIRLSGGNADQNMRWNTFGNTLTMTIVDSMSRMDAAYTLSGDQLSWVQIGTNNQIRATRDIPGLAFTHTGANNCVVSIGTETAAEIEIPAACPQGHNVTGTAAAVWSDSAGSYVGGFAGTSITSVIIPGSVTSIGNFSFYESNVITVIIGNGVTTIGEGAFQSCYGGLSSIIIPDSVTSIGRSAFSRCGLSSITIGRGVTSIGQAAFSNNSLTSVTFLGTIPAGGFDANAMGWSGAEGYMGDLRAKYLAGGPGTYTRSGEVWTRQR
ncbi:MAG: leucine-rich repeat domain-containing protein [Treponema sp.]|nr:leucine-rich repeat domain-containing protein [Treponema sp.]